MLITLTGKPCSGKSTLAGHLVKEHGFTRIGVGDMFKDEAKKRGMSAEEFNALCSSDPSFDYFLDEKTAQMGRDLEGQKYIFDSRLAWHFVPKSFKIYVDVREDEMVRRLVTSDRTGKEKYNDAVEAKRTLLNRRKLESERYKKLYHVDIDDLSNYDLVIDTSDEPSEVIAEKVWKAYQEFCKKSTK